MCGFSKQEPCRVLLRCLLNRCCPDFPPCCAQAGRETNDNRHMENVDSPPGDLPRRSSRQRNAVQHAIAHAHQPLLPPEILALAQVQQPTLGIATVYRNLKILLDAGEVLTVELPGEPTRYESAHRGHHHHFHCSRCLQVFDIPGCPPQLEQFAPAGYQVERHELTLYGVCAQCAQATG